MITIKMYTKLVLKTVAFTQCVFSFVIQYCVYLITPLLPAASCHSENTPLGEQPSQGSPIVLVHNSFYFLMCSNSHFLLIVG